MKACGCSCGGCSEQGNGHPEHPATGETEVGADQPNSTMGEAQHQQSQVSENASSERSQMSESGDCVLGRSELVEECAALKRAEIVQNSAGAFTRSWTAADGHCLYRGVSEHITGGQAAFSQMRWAAAVWLKDHWEQMKPSY